MVTHPQNYLEGLTKGKIDCFTFHYEAEYQQLKPFCRRIKENGMEVGISIKPKTELNEEILECCSENLIDKVLIMTVEPGFGGQKFM